MTFVESNTELSISGLDPDLDVLNSIAKDYTPQQIGQFLYYEGIRDLDPETIRLGIEMGADVNKPYTFAWAGCTRYTLPWMELAENGRFWSSHKAGGNPCSKINPDPREYLEYEDKMREIIEMICAKGLDVTTVDDRACIYTDGLLSGITKNFDPESIANIVTTTIYDTAATPWPYKINYDSIFSGIGDEADHPSRLERKILIDQALNRVKERLLNPVSEREQKLAAEHPDIVERWLVESVPDILELPVPSKEAAMKLHAAAAQRGGVSLGKWEYYDDHDAVQTDQLKYRYDEAIMGYSMRTPESRFGYGRFEF